MVRPEATKVGVVVGMLFGAGHLLWALLVAAHLAQPVIDFIFWLHFIRPVFVVESFDFGRAVVLVLVTASIGFVLGSFAWWAWVQVHNPILPRDFS